jgi:hypothetical protein
MYTFLLYTLQISSPLVLLMFRPDNSESIFLLASDASQRSSLPISSQASFFWDVIYKTNLSDSINIFFLCILILKFLSSDYSMIGSER